MSGSEAASRSTSDVERWAERRPGIRDEAIPIREGNDLT